MSVSSSRSGVNVEGPNGERSDVISSGGTFQANSGAEYRWKTHRGRFQVRTSSTALEPGDVPSINPSLSGVQLIKSDDPEKKPVAEFHPHKRHFFVFRMSKHAFFEVQPIPEITDAIDKFIGTHIT